MNEVLLTILARKAEEVAASRASSMRMSPMRRRSGPEHSLPDRYRHEGENARIIG